MELKVNLVKFISRDVLEKKHRCMSAEFTARSLLRSVASLFFELEGEAVPVVVVTRKLGLEKAGKFAYIVLRRSYLEHILCRAYDKEKRRVLVWPAALIFKSDSGEVLEDLTRLPEFYGNLDKISQRVVVNILREPKTLYDLEPKTLYDLKPKTLYDLTLPFKGREREAAERIIELARMTAKEGVYTQDQLVDYVNRGFILSEISQKTRDARYRFCDMVFDFILWYGTGERGDEFSQEQVTCEYVDERVELPRELVPIGEKIIEEKKREAEAKGVVFDNHPMYKLLKISLERYVVHEERVRKHRVHLVFGPTNFYTSVITNQLLDSPILRDEEGKPTTIREKYLKDLDLSEPHYLRSSFLSNMFGVALATVSEDNKILLQERSRQVFMGPKRITVATAENMLRGVDVDEEGKPNLFLTAKRCIKEEVGEQVGLEVKLEDIKFLGFGVRLDNLLPQALGIVRLRRKHSEIEFAGARDRWEGRNYWEEFEPSALRKYFREPYLISDTAKLTILLALINQYGAEYVKEKICRAET